MCACPTMDKKRQRPYSDFERQLLLQLVEANIDVIENRKTDGISQKKKMEAWELITSQFNNSATVTQIAESKQLKKMWQNLKAKARDAKTLEAQTKRTGGGPPPPEMGSLETQVVSMMPNIMPSIEVIIDSDTVSNANQTGEEDNDSLFWQPKRARINIETSTNIMPEVEKGTSGVTVVEALASTSQGPNGSSAKNRKNINFQKDLSFDEIKKKLLWQELEFNKKRFEAEMDRIKEKHELEIEHMKLKNLKELEILELKQEILKKELDNK